MLTQFGSPYFIRSAVHNLLWWVAVACWCGPFDSWRQTLVRHLAVSCPPL